MLPDGVRRFFRFGRARDVEREVDAEFAFHLEARTEALIAAGLSADAAHAEALRQFGDMGVAREDVIRTDCGEVANRSRRDWLGAWLLDTRYALRSLARTPGLTAAVLVMLGLGIGGAAAMYGLLDRLLLSVGPGIEAPGELRQLWVREHHRWEHATVFDRSFSVPQLRAIERDLPSGFPLGFVAHWADRLDGRTGPRIPIALVSGNVFEVLGTTPAIGRLLRSSDDTPSSTPATVISYALWHRKYSGDPAVIGQLLQLGKARYTIVGVAPRGFADLHPDRVDAWVPEAIGGDAHVGRGWQDMLHGFEAVVRMPDDAVALEIAARAQNAYRQAIAPRGDSTARAVFASLLPYQRPDGLGERTRLSLVVAAVAAILCIIAVANATNLLLLRATGRRREIAIRMALGSGRVRLVRAVILESLMLALGGALAAGVVASWGGELLRKLIVREDWQSAILDGRVVIFAAILGLVIGLVTGLVPGLAASGPEAIAALRTGSRSDVRPSRLRGGLLVMQATLTVLLLAGLGLYGRSFLRARAMDFGVASQHLINVNVEADRGDSMAQPGRLAAATAELAERMRRLPGVVGVAQTSITPIYGYGGAYLRAEGVDSLPMDQSGPFVSEIDTAFLGVTGLTLMRGRAFVTADIAPLAPVALVNEAMAKALWPGGEALGKCLRVGSRGEPSADVCRQVVGVVSNYRNQLDETAPMKNYYLPLGYRWQAGGNSLVLRTSGAAAPLLPAVLATLRERLPDSEPDAVTAIGEIVNRQIDPWRSGTTLFALFAMLAVLLAAGGLYSSAAYSVAQRAHEFGIRVAVGAAAKDLVRLVLVTSLRPIAIGLLLGLALTLYLVRFLEPLLYATAPRDPVVLSGAALTLLAAACVACIVPARAAARTDPRVALQAD